MCAMIQWKDWYVILNCRSDRLIEFVALIKPKFLNHIHISLSRKQLRNMSYRVRLTNKGQIGAPMDWWLSFKAKHVFFRNAKNVMMLVIVKCLRCSFSLLQKLNILFSWWSNFASWLLFCKNLFPRKFHKYWG